MFNIKTVQLEMMAKMIGGVEETILNLFEEFSRKYSWFDETSKNIHFFNGWKTNKGWKINKKIIIPLSRYYEHGDTPYSYNKTYQKIHDITKVFNYLDGGITEDVDILNILHDACKKGITKKIKLKYFTVTFYQKGTCHIEFLYPELLAKFNLFGSQHKGWLPPCYGKTTYNNMTKEEQAVIDDYEGEAEYNKVLSNTDYYIYSADKVLMIGA